MVHCEVELRARFPDCSPLSWIRVALTDPLPEIIGSVHTVYGVIESRQRSAYEERAVYMTRLIAVILAVFVLACSAIAADSNRAAAQSVNVPIFAVPPGHNRVFKPIGAQA